MLGKAHLALGAITGAAVAATCAHDPAALWALPVGLVAGGLADVLDSQHAVGREPLGLSWRGIKYTLRRKHKTLVDLLWLLPRVVGALLLDLIARAIPHRGLTHWLSTWALLSSLVWTLAQWGGGGHVLPLAFAGGYLSHLLADGLTFSGVPYFGPLSAKSLHLLPKPLRFRYDAPVQWLIVATYGGLVTLAGASQWALLLGIR